MRTRGWQGHAPRTEAEATERIVAAAQRCVARHGAAKTTLADVAAELGVTRQTVYRYFAGMPAILYAVGNAHADVFLGRLTAHVARFEDPAEVLVEAMAFTIEQVPGDGFAGLLLQVGESQLFARGATSSTSMHFAREMMRRLPIDWARTPLDAAGVDNLTEVLLRVVVSLLEHPSDPPRTDAELREFLRAMIGPMLAPRAVAGR